MWSWLVNNRYASSSQVGDWVVDVRSISSLSRDYDEKMTRLSEVVDLKEQARLVWEEINTVLDIHLTAQSA